MHLASRRNVFNLLRSHWDLSLTNPRENYICSVLFYILPLVHNGLWLWLPDVLFYPDMSYFLDPINGPAGF